MGKRGPRPEKGESRDRIGNVEIHKGRTKEGNQVVQWDAIIPCEGEHCHIFEVCPYEKAGRCRVRAEYLMYVHEIMHGQIDPNNRLSIFRLGMELIPLFGQLIDIKIASYGARPTFVHKNGMGVNPILRELRPCIKAISDTLGSLTTMGAFDKSGPKGVDSLIGDTNYYDELLTGTPAKEEFSMRNRV
jgi:hypothetical protein